MLKRGLIFLITVVFLLGGSSLAGAAYYEYYSGLQGVKEGDSYFFEFNLMEINDDAGTNSGMDLIQDVAMGFDALPLESAYVKVVLGSIDFAWEHVTVALDAHYAGGTQSLFSGKFNGTIFDPLFVIERSLDNILFLNDPVGDILITANITGKCHTNNFWIKHVGIGGVPGGVAVPEPGTALLLGIGFLGIAGVSRKRLVKRR